MPTLHLRRLALPVFLLLPLTAAPAPARSAPSPPGTSGTAASSASPPTAKAVPSTAAPSTPAPSSTNPGTPASTTPAPSAPSAADKAVAGQKYDQASALAKQGKWEQAYPHFLEAWQRFPHWQIALGLGRVEIELGKFHAAEGHLAFAQEATDLPAADRTEVDRLIALARKNQGSIRLVATAQATARILLDDRRVGITPFSGTISADPGEHRLELRLGTSRRSRLVQVVTGQTIDVDIDLRIAETTPSATSPPASPPPDPAPPPAPANDPPPASISPLLRSVLLGTGAGLALAAFATGTGFAIASINSPVPADREVYESAAVASLVIGGVLTAGTAVQFFTLPRAPKPTTTTLQLRWTGLGLQTELRW